MTTHYLEEAEQLCRDIAILDHGEIVVNTDMRSLLASLDVETFVLDLSAPLASPPVLADVANVQLPDPTSLTVTLKKGQSLNAVFNQLSALGIEVASMRNQSNRLEELFLNLVEHNLTEKLTNS